MKHPLRVSAKDKKGNYKCQGSCSRPTYARNVLSIVLCFGDRSTWSMVAKTSSLPLSTTSCRQESRMTCSLSGLLPNGRESTTGSG